LNDAVIVSAARLPIGKFGGTLKDVSDWDLGTIVIAEAVKRVGVKGHDVDKVIMAHGLKDRSAWMAATRKPD
jgi:acetyl-CoA C-acetyltransferase